MKCNVYFIIINGNSINYIKNLKKATITTKTIFFEIKILTVFCYH